MMNKFLSLLLILSLFFNLDINSGGVHSRPAGSQADLRHTALVNMCAARPGMLFTGNCECEDCAALVVTGHSAISDLLRDVMTNSAFKDLYQNNNRIIPDCKDRFERSVLEAARKEGYFTNSYPFETSVRLNKVREKLRSTMDVIRSNVPLAVSQPLQILNGNTKYVSIDTDLFIDLYEFYAELEDFRPESAEKMQLVGTMVAHFLVLRLMIQDNKNSLKFNQ